MCGNPANSQPAGVAPPLPHSECLEWLLRSNEAPVNPCFVLDVPRLEHNLGILDYVQKVSGAKILLALKAFAMWPVFGHISRAFNGPLWGICASSVDEARLGREDFRGEVHAFAAAWSLGEMEELLATADHIVFNSTAQWLKYRGICESANHGLRKNSPISFGLRVNPEFSTASTAIYNPCAPQSRLGIRCEDMPRGSDFSGISGLHFHALCEQDSYDLAGTLEAFEIRFKHWLEGRKWLNFGGGHHITRPGYNLRLLCDLILRWRKNYSCQVYLEPGEAVALNAGWLTSTVLDVVNPDMPTAILDVSAACHMPDVLEMPYTPPLWYLTENGAIEAKKPGEAEFTVRIAGKSCLAGDVAGEYSFDRAPQVGDRLVFGDMAIYSMVKTNTFNGLRLPDIAIFDPSSAPEFSILRSASYDDFKCRLG